jgi:aryl-alcohol dehydrogenase-like predicted oxidoreductase
MKLTRREFCAQATAALLAGAAPAVAKEASMLTRSIPGTDESLPVIGMGTWSTFDVGASASERAPLAEVLRLFYAAGGKVIDSSPMYGRAERVTGDLMEKLGKRSETFVATKVWTSGREKGLSQIEQSMRLLKSPRLDLLQIHNLVDWQTHARTLRMLKEEGRIRYTGITHYTVGAHDELQRVLEAEPFDFVQLNYSIATRDAEKRLLPYCRERGIAVLVNRPFEEGALFTRVKGRRLPAFAAEIDCTSWAQFFLKFIISHPAVTCVIPATSRPAHMEDNLKAGFGRLPDAPMRERMAQEFLG